MQKKAVITGSFNPVTSGHLFLLEKGLELFDRIYMVILVNPDKTYLTTVVERLDMLKKAVGKYDNVVVDAYDGYACDYCINVGAKVMLRGVRNPVDLNYELDLRRQNLEFKGIDTILLVSDDSHRNVSSTFVREHGHE